jgi:predicted nucleotidyltransferase
MSACLPDILLCPIVRSVSLMPLSPADLERLRPVLERIVARLRPEEIWLFGSRAENRARPKSDFDLLAILPDGTPEAELDPVRAWSIVRGLGVPVDLVPCTRSEFEEEKHEIDTLARAAFLRGIQLYERTA